MSHRNCFSTNVYFIGFILVVSVIFVPNMTLTAASPVQINLDLGLGEVFKLWWERWKSLSDDAKKNVPVEDLIREMNNLVGQRENFIPPFEQYVHGVPVDTELLRNEASAMLKTAKNIEDMVKKLDPGFASAHSEVHIRSVKIAADRSVNSSETVQIFDSRGVNINRDDLIRRLRIGTCDLRQVIRNIRSAAGLKPEPLSPEDKGCKVK
jgi:hypothetical protein